MNTIHEIYRLFYDSDPLQTGIDMFLVEELNELSVEILHNLRKRSSRFKMGKEVADVEILLYQIKKKYELFGIVNDVINKELLKVPNKIEATLK